MDCTAVEHIIHPGHPLSKLKSDNEYLCHACKTYGEGIRFQCDTCDFNWHEYCMDCPKSLPSFMHPHNDLSLVLLHTSITNTRECNVCNENIEGHFYCCSECEFDVHPICSQLPQHLPHVLHPAHVLTLQQSSNKACKCLVCGEDCSSNSWRYGCGDCQHPCDIHLQCLLLEPCDLVTKTRQLGLVPQVHDWPQEPHHGVGYYFGLVPSSATNPYNNAYEQYHQTPGYNTHVAFGSNPYNMACPNYMLQVPTHNMNNSYDAAPGYYNMYTGYANEFQTPTHNYVHNTEAPGCNGQSNADVEVPSGSNPSGSSINCNDIEHQLVPEKDGVLDGNQIPQPRGRKTKIVFKIFGQIGIGIISSLLFEGLFK